MGTIIGFIFLMLLAGCIAELLTRKPQEPPEDLKEINRQLHNVYPPDGKRPKYKINLSSMRYNSTNANFSRLRKSYLGNDPLLKRVKQIKKECFR